MSNGNFQVTLVHPQEVPADAFTRAATIFNITLEVILYGIMIFLILLLIIATLGFFLKGF
jgi:type IV secretory pathway VirB3-like protein